MWQWLSAYAVLMLVAVLFWLGREREPWA